MELKTSAEIVDELFKELQGKSNLNFIGSNSINSDEDKNAHSDHDTRTASPKDRENQRKYDKDSYSCTDSDTTVKHRKYRKKHKRKKKKKKHILDNSSKGHRHYSKRRHKQKHKLKSENNTSECASNTLYLDSENSFEIEWESDHNSNTNFKGEDLFIQSGIENKSSKELISRLNEEHGIMLVENKGAVEITSADVNIKATTSSVITNEIVMLSKAPQTLMNSVNNSSNESTSLKVDDKCSEISTIKISSGNDSSKENIDNSSHFVTLTMDVISDNIASKNSEASNAKIESTNNQVILTKEDHEQNNNADKSNRENSICSSADSDGEVQIEFERKKRKKSSKKRKKRGKKRKHSCEEISGKEKKHHSRSRSKSYSPYRPRKQRKSPSHSGDSSSSPPDQSPSHQHKKRKYRDKDNRRSHLYGSSVSPSRQKRYSRSRSHDRERRRSRSPRKSHSGEAREKIDKVKLLEIARKNAMVMISQGKLPAGVNVDCLKKEQLVSIKSGGKSVEELTDFCKQLVKKGDTSSSDSERKEICSEDEDEGPFIQHPFKLRDAQPNIVLNIRNAVQLPVKTPAEKAAETAKLRIQFPVSSGSQHRKKESEWIPVSSQAKDSLPLVIQPQSDKVFQEKSTKPEVIDVGTIISQRLQAVRKLQENPQDVEALSQMYCAQQQMQTWAESKQLPGQFTGVTDARLLTPAELAGPAHTQAWVKKVIALLASFFCCGLLRSRCRVSGEGTPS